MTTQNFAVAAVFVLALLPWMVLCACAALVALAGYRVMSDDREVEFDETTAERAVVDEIAARVEARFEAESQRSDWHRAAEGRLVEVFLD